MILLERIFEFVHNQLNDNELNKKIFLVISFLISISFNPWGNIFHRAGNGNAYNFSKLKSLFHSYLAVTSLIKSQRFSYDEKNTFDFYPWIFDKLIF